MVSGYREKIHSKSRLKPRGNSSSHLDAARDVKDGFSNVHRASVSSNIEFGNLACCVDSVTLFTVERFCGLFTGNTLGRGAQDAISFGIGNKRSAFASRLYLSCASASLTHLLLGL